MNNPDTITRLESQISQLQEARMEEFRERDRLRCRIEALEADIAVKARLLTRQAKQLASAMKAVEILTDPNNWTHRL